MEQHEIDAILRSLAVTMDYQRTINDDLRAFNRQQLTINDRLTTAIERLEVTLAAIKDMLGRGNGH